MSARAAERDVPRDLMYRANLIGCSRCSNEGQDDPIPFARSWARFVQRGWAFEGGRVFCPPCNGDMDAIARADRKV